MSQGRHGHHYHYHHRHDYDSSTSFISACLGLMGVCFNTCAVGQEVIAVQTAHGRGNPGAEASHYADASLAAQAADNHDPECLLQHKTEEARGPVRKQF